MHNETKTCGNACSNLIDNPVMALGILRVGVGVFFMAFGAMKLFIMGPDAIVGMMTKVLGVTGSMSVLAAWVVMIVEFFGGAILLLGNKVPEGLYKATLIGFVVITIVGYFSANGGDLKQLLWHSQLLLMIVALMVSRPKCPIGMTGSCKV